MSTQRTAKAPTPRAPRKTSERRKSNRLRELIDDFRTNITTNRRELEFQFQRIAEIQADLDRLKQGWEKV